MFPILEKILPQRTKQPQPLEELIRALAKLPGLGPRSARRTALHLLKHRETTLAELIRHLATAQAQVCTCVQCGNYDTQDPCWICADPARDAATLCIVEDVDDLWALERSGAYKGRYHILGGTLSALAGMGPDQLRIAALMQRVAQGEITEIILALGATVEGQTTSHYIAERVRGLAITVTRPAQGMPMGGEVDYLDDGTLLAAFKARRTF